jgi:hypothetical protein
MLTRLVLQSHMFPFGNMPRREAQALPTEVHRIGIAPVKGASLAPGSTTGGWTRRARAPSAPPGGWHKRRGSGALFELEDKLQCAVHRRPPDGLAITTEELPLGEQLDVQPSGRDWPHPRRVTRARTGAASGHR